jgi:hypothetical protein
MTEHHVVTLHSNPCRYARPEANYWTFREALPSYVQLHTMEVSYDGEFRIPDAHHVAAGPEHLLWQKEAALRWMIRERVPAAADVVSWCDADAMFDNADGFDEAAARIRAGDCVVCQPFSICRRLDADGAPERDQPAWAAVHTGDITEGSTRPAPGFAWTAPRDIAERLFIRDIGGGGDQTQCHLWTGQFTHSRLIEQNQTWRRATLRRGVWHYRRVRERIGYVPGVASHLWHGDSEHRQYGERQRVMTANAYDPDADVEIDPANGLLRWASEKSALHQYMRDLFQLRREDG